MPCEFKEFLEKIAGERTPGPSRTFSVLHILQALELLAEKTIGRNKLAEELGVGDGAIRTIIHRLKNAGLIDVSKTGCSLTEKGSKIWKECKSVLAKKIEFGNTELVLADHNFAILVKDCASNVESGMTQRDAAIRVGARSTTTIVFKERRLQIPSVSDNVAKDFPKTAKKVISLLKPSENDVVVIGGGDTSLGAEYGTLAAAWTLVSDC